MSGFPAIRGFQSAIVVIMLTYAVITLTHSINVEAAPTLAEPLQDQIAAPPSKAAMDELMKVAELQLYPRSVRPTQLAGL
jgi:hypothetical protein